MHDIDIPDVNVWLALAAPDHVHHARAKLWLESEAATSIGFCQPTVLGTLRLLCNPIVMGGRAVSFESAWAGLEGFLAMEGVRLLAEPQNLLGTLKAIHLKGGGAGKHVTDLAIASYAMGYGARVVSFDRVFKNMGGVASIILEA